MSVSQQEASLTTENRELRERLQGALADVEILKSRLGDAEQARASAEDQLMAASNRVRQLEAEKQLMWEKVNG